MNPYDKQDILAQQQAIEAIGDTYTIRRKVINKFDNYGRPLKKDFKETIFGVLVPSGKTLQLDTNGHGVWVSSTFTFTCVVPNFITEGDILETPYGDLKVTDVNDMSMWGNMSGTLKRIGATEKIKNEVI